MDAFAKYVRDQHEGKQKTINMRHTRRGPDSGQQENKGRDSETAQQYFKRAHILSGSTPGDRLNAPLVIDEAFSFTLQPMKLELQLTNKDGNLLQLRVQSI